jgi:putative transposase
VLRLQVQAAPDPITDQRGAKSEVCVRLVRTVREQFLVEVAHSGIEGLDELNRLFSAWVETVYHRAVHSETGHAPLERFLAAGAPRPADPEQLGDAFRWAERRRVTKTATVSLFGNHYQVDAALVGERIELVFDPFALEHIEVRFQGRPMGQAVPQRIGRHVHPAARAEPGPTPPASSGIDYLRLVEARRRAELSRRIDYRDLPAHPDMADNAGDHDPGATSQENPR